MRRLLPSSVCGRRRSGFYVRLLVSQMASALGAWLQGPHNGHQFLIVSPVFDQLNTREVVPDVVDDVVKNDGLAPNDPSRMQQDMN